MRRLPHGDDGALAVMVALLAFMIFGLAALAMDLGNAFTRNRDVQYQADFAALAGGSGLPAPSLVPTASDEAVVKAAQYLFENQPQNDDADFLTAAEVVSVLVDGDETNGQAYYGHFTSTGVFVPSQDELTVRTPPALVKYGFAAILGTSEVEVNAYATVGLGSPGAGVMPFFAVSGCDYGPQVLSDPANGQVQATQPTMLFPTDTNKAELTSLTPAAVNVTAPAAVPTQTIAITGKFLQGVTKVGFFRRTAPSALTPNFFETTTLDSSDSTGKLVKNIFVPNEVTSTTDEGGGSVWWVRVYAPKNNSPSAPSAWSAVAKALPMRVGPALLKCPGGSNDGNFGSLKLPRTSNPATWLPDNIALGLEAPLSLVKHPLAPDPYCTPGVPPTVYSDTSGSPTLLAGTNCVDTDTGLTANATTQGLVTGGPGRLLKPTTSGCSPQRNDSERAVAIGGGYSINDDTLSCFFTTPDSVATIASPTYAGPPVLSPEIYSSPRFFWVPVLAVQPATGGSQRYSIVDFRAAFLTSDSLTSTKAAPAFEDGNAATTTNGLTIANNGITSMQVVFFNHAALPNDAGGAATTQYMGVGPKILRMTN